MKANSEIVLVSVFFAVVLFLGPGSYLDHTIAHDFPYGYGASDAFQHQVRAEAIKDAGNFKYEAPYISAGIEGAVGRYPPLLYHLAVILSVASGIEVYDSIYFLMLIFCVLGMVAFYCILRGCNKTMAMLSLPITMLIFSFPASIGLYWGHWPSILGQVFLISFFWAVSRTEIKNSWVLVACSMSAIVLSHTSEAMFGALFAVIFLVWKWWSRSLGERQFLNLAIGDVVTTTLCSYYVIIFMNTWAKAQPYQFGIEPVWSGNPGFYLAGFGLLLIPLVVGAFISFIKSKEAHVAVIVGFSMLLMSFMNYVGFGLRSFQLRFFWPIYLSVFFGLGLYFFLKFAMKRIGGIAAIACLVVMSIAVSGIVAWPILAQGESNSVPSIPSIKAYGQGMMDSSHWQMLEWIGENTPQDSKVYFFYGDIYSNDALLRNSKRIHSQADPQGFVEKINERTISREYLTEQPGDTGGGMVTRSGTFSFKDPFEDLPSDYFFGTRDICMFDYFVFDRVSRQQVLAEYNMLIASELEKNRSANVVYSNDAVVILKNNRKGEACIEERTF